MSSTTAGEQNFAGYLARLAERDDRGALAALRRGLGKEPGEAPEMFPYVVPWLPRQASIWAEQAYYLVASLFGLHSKPWNRGPDARSDLGASLERVNAG